MKTAMTVLAIAAALMMFVGTAGAAQKDSGQAMGKGPGQPGPQGGNFQPPCRAESPRMQGPGGPAMGQGMGRGQGGPDEMMGIMDKLNVTDEQRDRIETIIDGNRDKADLARNAVERAHRTLEKAVRSDANDAAIQNAANALGTAMGNEAILKVKTMRDIKAVLTPEQVKQFETLKTKMKQRRAMMGGQGPKGPDSDGPPQGQPEQPQ